MCYEYRDTAPDNGFYCLDRNPLTLTKVVHLLRFDTVHTGAEEKKTLQFRFSAYSACHVPFLLPLLRSLRGNRCCLFIILRLNGTTMKICHSLSVIIVLFHYRPFAGGS